MKANTIVGYTFKAENLCAECVIDALPTGPGEDFDGWLCMVPMDTEDNLNEIAAAISLDRDNENTFDSDYFPKVIFSSSIEQPEQCGRCGLSLGD
jgi:hypothetical protein